MKRLHVGSLFDVFMNSIEPTNIIFSIAILYREVSFMAIGCFLKFGKFAHLKSLSEGQLYFSPIQTLRAREEEFQKGIGDKYEGGLQMAKGDFQLNSVDKSIPLPNCTMNLSFEPLDNALVFCLSFCSNDECSVCTDGKLRLTIVPERLKWFREHFNNYDSVAVIKDPNTFIDNMEKAFPCGLKHHAISYPDKVIRESGMHPINILWNLATKGENMVPYKKYYVTSNDMNEFLFYKDSDFAIENEYRFALCDESQKSSEPKLFSVNITAPIEILPIDTLLSNGTVSC